MSLDQGIVFGVLGVALVLFAWGRWRYDLVAVAALLAVVFAGVVPPGEAFAGFGHPAVVIVAAVLVLSRALQNAGVVDALIRLIAPTRGRENVQIAAQSAVTAALSGMMNNVGALALMLPVAVRNAYRDNYSPAKSLMPLAFSSLLGGLVTLIGTPPNIIISSYRTQALGAPYSMFDFAPVGGAIAVVGVLFVGLVGWRLIPKDRRATPAGGQQLDIGTYLLECRPKEGGSGIGQSVLALERLAEGDVAILGVARGDRGMHMLPAPDEVIGADSVLLLQARGARQLPRSCRA
jgi:di/tricarboxylate transporter